MTLTSVPAGSHTYFAQAIDDGGIATRSSSVTIVVATSPSMYYIHADQINAPRVVTDQANRVVWRWDSADPFGAALPDEDPDGDGVRFILNLRFPRQYYDRETGSHYNYYRDYDPQTGRYVDSDPIGLRGGINTYGYVDAAPTLGIDPLGLFDPHGSVVHQINPLKSGASGPEGGLPWIVPVGVGVITALWPTSAAAPEAASTSPQPTPQASAPRTEPVEGKPEPTDQIRNPERSKRGEARCRCKAATNAEGGRGPTPQEWFYAQRSGPAVPEAARAACRQANKYIGIAYPGCQGEHCHCVCSDNGGPPYPYNPR